METSMRIAICGAGLVGSYLYRLLDQAGYKRITLFESSIPPATKCGLTPSAWAASSGFAEMLEPVGFDPADYILGTFDQAVLNGIKVKARVMVIDKPRLVSALLKGAAVKHSQPRASDFDRIVDATGFARAYLPALSQDLIATCVQSRVSSPERWDVAIDISNQGYAWRFPLFPNEYHIGAASAVMPPQKLLENLGWLNNSRQVCACSSKLRLAGPHSSLPFTYIGADRPTPVWGAGEAIGCVSPLMGEGILPGVKSAAIMLANWEAPEAYREAILREFSWMKEERQVLDKMVLGKKLGIFDAAALSHTAKRLKMNLDYVQALNLLSTVNRTL
jgi:flavin-dependent dehydrogenase